MGVTWAFSVFMAVNLLPPVFSIVCDKTLKTESGISCYRVVDGAHVFDQSQYECVRLGGNLVTITTPEENNLVLTLMNERTMQDIWLGLREMQYKWRWIDGREIRGQGCYKDNKNSSDIIGLTQQYPNNSPEVCIRGCAALGNKYAALHDGGSCTCGDTFGRYGQEHAACNIQCPRLNDTAPLAYCGGSFSNDVYAVHGEYSNWQPGQPNDHQGYQTCAALDGENGYLWNDVNCWERQGSICEIREAGTCEGENTVKVQKKCYYVNTDSLGYFKARAACWAKKGDLATFLSADEEKPVVDLIISKNFTVSGYWIGLVRWKWEWVTGEEVYFTFWSPDQPNGPSQNCASLDREYGRWEDEECTSIHKIICEIDNSTFAKATTKSQVTKFAPKTAPPPTTTTTTTPMPTSAKPNVLDKMKDFYENNKIAVYVIAAVGGFMVLSIIISVAICCQKGSKAKNQAQEEDVTADHFFEMEPGADNVTAENGIMSDTTPDVIPKDVDVVKTSDNEINDETNSQ